jgi:hypothetical protein
MKKFAAPLAAVAATSVSLGAAAQAIASQAMSTPGGLGGLLQLNPDPSVAYLMAVGFLGVIVLRRTRSGPMN